MLNDVYTIGSCYSIKNIFLFVSHRYHSVKENICDDDDECEISGLRRVLPQILAVCVKNLVMFGKHPIQFAHW